MTEKGLPEGAEKYRETKEFTEVTVPKGLLADHNTAAGVWGLLVIVEGSLDYTRTGKLPVEVTRDAPAVIYPQEPHHITCDRPVRFRVEFYRIRS